MFCSKNIERMMLKIATRNSEWKTNRNVRVRGETCQLYSPGMPKWGSRKMFILHEEEDEIL